MSEDFYRLGLEHLEKGNLKEAEEALQRHLERYPEDAMGYNKLGLVYAKQKATAKAKECFSKAVELDRSCIHAWNNLGNIARLEGDLEQAVAYYRQAVAIDPQNPIPAKNLKTAERQAKWSFQNIKKIFTTRE